LASDVRRFDKEPVATLASFHENSVVKVSQSATSGRLKTSAKKIQKNATPARKTLLALQNVDQSVPRADKTAALSTADILEAEFKQTEAATFRPTVFVTFDEAPASQAFFVVMQTVQYKNAGPTYRISVWRITVLRAMQIRNPRIPAKQI